MHLHTAAMHPGPAFAMARPARSPVFEKTPESINPLPHNNLPAPIRHPNARFATSPVAQWE